MKNYFRTTFSEGKLDDLSLLGIENDLLNIINTENIIAEFSHLKY